MDPPQRPKIIAKVSNIRGTANGVRSPSPARPSSTVSSAPLRPRAKVTTSVSGSRNSTIPSSPSVISRTPSTLSNVSAPPRAPSPFKQRVANGATSPPAPPVGVRARVTVRASGSATSSVVNTRSRDTSPELRPRTSTTKLAERSASRKRSGSLTVQRVTSHSSLGLQTPVNTPAPLPGDASTPSSPAGSTFGGQVRVKSKVSGLAKKPPISLSPGAVPPSSPPGNDVTTRPNAGPLRIRAVSTARPSISFDPASPSPASASTHAHSPSFTIYPITAGSPAANAHRYAPNRPSSRPGSRSASPAPRSAYLPEEPSPLAFRTSLPHAPGPISKASSSASTLSALSFTPKVDPTLVPLPPHSPPGSTVSFSSRSSVSTSSWAPSSATQESFTTAARSLGAGSTVNDQAPPVNGQDAMSGIGLMMQLADAADGSMESPNVMSGSEVGTTNGVGRERAEAKSNRKIADLEITNRSLLAINSSLETTKHRQQREIVDLRRKLRESRLALPPRAYRAAVAQDEPDEEEEEDEDEDSSSQTSEKGTEGPQTKADETYSRCCMLLDALLGSAKAALAVQPVDLVPPEGKGGTKVLSPEEVRTWRRDSVADIFAGGAGDLSIISEAASHTEDTELDEGDSFAFSNNSGLGLGLGDLSNGTISAGNYGESEDEVEASLYVDDADLSLHPPRQSLTPPIIISRPTSP